MQFDAAHIWRGSFRAIVIFAVLTSVALFFAFLRFVVEPVSAEGFELVKNGDFSNGLSLWSASGDVVAVSGVAQFDTLQSTLTQYNIALREHTPAIYELSFQCKSTHSVYWVEFSYTLSSSNPDVGVMTGKSAECYSTWKTVTKELLLLPGENYTLSFTFSARGAPNESVKAQLDNASLQRQSNLDAFETGIVANGDLVGPGSWTYGSDTTYYMHIGAASRQLGAVEFSRRTSNALLTQEGISVVEPDATLYTFALDCKKSNSVYFAEITFKVIPSSNPSNPVLNQSERCSTAWETYTMTVTLSPGESYKLTIQYTDDGSGGNADPLVEIDNISLINPSLLGLLDRMVLSAQPECPLCGAQNTVGWVGGPVNTENGNLSYQATDLSIPVKGGALTFQRSYASGASSLYTTTMGYGWTHNYEIRLHFDNTELPDTVELQAPGGSRLSFFDNSDGTYTAYPGVTAQLAYINPTYVVTAFNQMGYTFDSQGLLTKQTDPSGNVITFTHNITDQLVMAAQGSRWLSYTYGSNGLLRQVTDNMGRTVGLGYNVNGDLSVMTDTLDLTTTYEYSGVTHLLTQVTDASGIVVEETAYDEQGRAYRQWDGTGNLLVDINYSLTNTHVITENSVVMVHQYDGRGLLVDITFSCSDGTTGCHAGIDRSYDYNFKAREVVDANRHSTNLTWTTNGSNLEQVSDALANTTSLSYDGLNNLTQTVNARIYTTTYGYGDAELTTFRTVVTDALEHTTVYTPTADGLLAAERDPNGNVTTYNYNDFGQVIQVVRAAGTPDAITTTYGYDDVGRLITTTQTSANESHTTLNVYDDGDRLIATIANWSGIDPAAWAQDCLLTAGPRDTDVCTRYDYDAAGRPISTTNALDQTNLTFYDAAGRVVTSVVNYDGTTAFSALCTSFTEPDPEYNICSLTGYDAFSRVVTATDSLGRETVTAYDALGRVSRTVANYVNGVYSAAAPDEDIETLYGYDAVGNTILVTDTLGHLTRTFYDELNRVAGTIDNWNGQTTLADCDTLPIERDADICTLYAYDEVGNTIIVTDTLGRLTRTFYDELNRVEVTVANWNPATLDSRNDCLYSPTNTAEENVCTAYGYDPAGNQITVTNALNQTTLTVYDAANRPVITVANWDGTPIDEASDCDFPPAETDTNGCAATTYDALGRRSQVKDPMGNETDFAYDGLGRVITTTQTLDGAPVETVMSYDALGNRLTATDAEGQATTFTYDTLDRLVTTTSAEGITQTQSYDAAGRVITTTDGLGQATVYTYDGQDRPLTTTDAENNVTTYEYDGLGNQVAMVDAEGVQTSYAYDGLNRLVSVTENDTGGGQTNDSNVLTQYVYDALGNRLVITNALGFTSTLTVYDDLNRPVTVTDALGNETVYAYDALGNRLTLTDGNGEVTEYTYDNKNC